MLNDSNPKEKHSIHYRANTSSHSASTQPIEANKILSKETNWLPENLPSFGLAPISPPLDGIFPNSCFDDLILDVENTAYNPTEISLEQTFAYNSLFDSFIDYSSLPTSTTNSTSFENDFSHPYMNELLSMPKQEFLTVAPKHFFPKKSQSLEQIPRQSKMHQQPTFFMPNDSLIKSFSVPQFSISLEESNRKRKHQQLEESNELNKSSEILIQFGNSTKVKLEHSDVRQAQKELSLNEKEKFRSKIETLKSQKTKKPATASIQGLSIFIKQSARSSSSVSLKLSIMTPVVGQKSYGTEKRFFCPPPLILFSGGNWFPKSKMDDFLKEFELSLAPDPSGILTINECGGKPNNFIDMSTSYNEMNGLAVFRNVFIGDLQKIRLLTRDNVGYLEHPHLNNLFKYLDRQKIKKDFDFYLKLQKTNKTDQDPFPSIHIGTFKSKQITLISKPSKKRPSMVPHNKAKKGKSEDVLPEIIYNGQFISLYNRVKSQNGSTRCLGLEFTQNNNIELTSKGVAWHPFQIHSLENKEIISNGSLVYLESLNPAWKSEPLIIRLVESKNRTKVGPENPQEPISQVQRIAFEHQQHPMHFLCADTSKIHFRFMENVYQVEEQSNSPEWNFPFTTIPDNALWTIVGVDYVDYSWFDPLILPSLPITPVPCIENCFPLLLDQKLFLNFSISIPTHSFLETLDCFIKLGNANIPLNQILDSLSWDIFLGNVNCPILHSEIYISDLKIEFSKFLQMPNPSTIPESLQMDLICEVPDFETCSQLGKWKPFQLFNVSLSNSMTLIPERKNSLDSVESERTPLFEEFSEDTLLATGFPKHLGGIEKINDELHLTLPLILTRRLDGIVYKSTRNLVFILSDTVL